MSVDDYFRRNKNLSGENNLLKCIKINWTKVSCMFWVWSFGSISKLSFN